MVSRWRLAVVSDRPVLAVASDRPAPQQGSGFASTGARARGRGQRTQENYSNRCQGDLKGYSHRTFVTEAGAALDKDNKDYEQYDASGHDGDVNSLRGLDDCLSALHDGGAPVLGVYPWHGYDNGDSYSFFGAKNGNGRAKMQRIQKRS